MPQDDVDVEAKLKEPITAQTPHLDKDVIDAYMQTLERLAKQTENSIWSEEREALIGVLQELRLCTLKLGDMKQIADDFQIYLDVDLTRLQNELETAKS